MTLDEFEQEVLKIKKKGLTKLTEINEIAKVRTKYHTHRISVDHKKISDQINRNIDYLRVKTRISPTASRVREFMGIRTDDYYSDAVKGNNLFYSFPQVIIIAQFYGLPVELLVFHDLKAYGTELWEKYPALFKQSTD